MSESLRAYTPPAAGSFDPYTIGITGGIPAFFGLREAPPPPVLTPAGTPDVLGDSISDGGGGGETGSSAIDLGPNPGSLDRGFGQAAYGRAGSTLGTLAGMAAGVPGLGLGLGALGTLADVRGLNADLAMMGLPQEVSFPSSFLSNMTAGYFGTPAATQFGNIAGFDIAAEAPLSAFSVPAGGPSEPSAPAGPTEAEAMEQGMQSPSFGTGSYGYGTDPSIGGSGNFGAMSAQERGESVGPPDSGPAGPSSNDSNEGAPSGPDGGSADGGAYREGGLVQFQEGGFVDFPDDEELPPEYSNFATARDYFQELNRADAERNLQGLPEISLNTGYDRNRGVSLQPYGGRIRAEMPVAGGGGTFDLGGAYQGATVSGRGFRQSRNLLQELGAGYTFPDGGRLSLDYFDRMGGGDMDSGPADTLNQDVRMPSDAELMGRPVPSRGVRLNYRREFAEGGLVPLAGGGKIAIGPGGGLDDLIPTSINGRRAAALSDGEFVIPADVVSMMGDGSSNAGARRLYDLVKQVRGAKTGTTKQAGPLPVGEILKRSIGR